MIGWRGKIAMVVPAPNTIAEWEFSRLIPEGVSLHVARCQKTPIDSKSSAAMTREALLKMNEKVVEAAERVASVKPEIIAWACTTASFVGGNGYDIKIAKKIMDKTGIKAITTTTAIILAIKQIGAKRIVLVTPYSNEIGKDLGQFLEETIQGLKIIKSRNLNLVGSEKGNMYPQTVYRVGKETNTQEADLVLLSCTNWRTLEIINLLENDIGKPVICSLQATVWACLKHIGVRIVPKGGVLLQRYL